MCKIVINVVFAGLLSVLAGPLVCAGEGTDASTRVVPVTEEPLHVVRHRGDHFMIYTNWIEPDTWTLYHAHRKDLLAVIPADSAAASQALNTEPRLQQAPAGSLVFFPYMDSSEPYLHRVGARGDRPFINIGLEFQDPLSSSCPGDFTSWDEPHAEPLARNRRGKGYRLTLPVAAEAIMPDSGRGLLLVPLGAASLKIDEASWSATLGDFRFYDQKHPYRLRNTGNTVAVLVVFNAC